MKFGLSEFRACYVFMTLAFGSVAANADVSISSLGFLDDSLVYTHGVTGINDAGQVSGYASDSPLGLPAGSIGHAFTSGYGGTGLKDLGTFGGSFSAAFGINASGQTIGQAYFSGNENYHAFISGADGVGMTDIGTLGGSRSDARGINSFGQVVGTSALAGDSAYRAFITGADGSSMQDLGSLGFQHSAAFGVNDSGQAVGGVYNSNGFMRAFVTGANGQDMVEYGNNTTGSYAGVAINNAGQVVFRSEDGSGLHSFVSGVGNSNLTDLGSLGGSVTIATDINESGQIVGVSFGYGNSSRHSFLYSGGTLYDLSLQNAVVIAGWSDLLSTAINDSGQIVGTGILGGVRQGFLMSGVFESVLESGSIGSVSAVPESETYAMLLAGLGLMSAVARRRKTKLTA